MLSSEFDYTLMLAKYDTAEIDNSVIKYYKSVQTWTSELMEKLDYYEREEHAVFGFISENTAKIVRNALRRIEFFESNQQYIEWVFDALKNRTENYYTFRTSYYEELKAVCEKYETEEKLFLKWYGVTVTNRTGFSFVTVSTFLINNICS